MSRELSKKHVSSNHQQDLPGKPEIKRILVMKWGALGDLVITTALFSDIRRAFPDATIDLQTAPAFAGLFAHDPAFNAVHAVNVRKKWGVWSWLKFVLQRKYDLVFDLQSNDRSRLFMLFWCLTGRAPRWRVGNHDRSPYNVARMPTNEVLHAFDLQRETLAAAGVPAVTGRPRLFPDRDNKERAATLMAANGLLENQFAVFFPGSQARGLLKRWGSDHYASLARKLRREGLNRVVLLGGPDDAQECIEISKACPEDWLVNLCSETKILDLVPFCAAAKLIVANDTGPAHVASSTPTPMIVICGPTDPKRVKPVGEHVVALQADLDCINCYQKECDHHSCMRLITPEMVVDKFISLQALQG